MTTDSNRIDVAVALPVYNTFTYQVPANLAMLTAIGKRVLVPFGARQLTGYIVGLHAEDRQEEIRNIVDVLDEAPLFPAAMIPFFFWMADYYKYPIGEVIKSALPGGLTVHDLTYASMASKGQSVLADGRASPLEAEILACFSDAPLNIKAIRKKLKREVSVAKLYAMEKRGWILVHKKLLRGRTRVKTERYVKLQHKTIQDSRLTPKREKVIALLQVEDDISVKRLKERIPGAENLIRPLSQNGQIEIYDKKV
ncbi:primosomal protein N', partial [Thermodesulfobacteriota bacterium]